ncbi:MAG: phosphate acyltransferase [Opitutales bacterium]
MPLIDSLTDKLRSHPKRLVFPDGDDPRILQAARQYVRLDLGVPILLGDRTRIKTNALSLNIRTEGMRLLEPGRSDSVDAFVYQLADNPRYAQLDRDALRREVCDPNTFACCMLLTGQASGMVSGATERASSALRPLLRIMPRQPGVNTLSSLQILDFEDPRVTHHKTFFLADCAVLPEPTAEQLADIAITTASLSFHLTNLQPKVALLSYTTGADPEKAPASIQRIQAATRLARQAAHDLKLDLAIEGDVQVDAALDPVIAEAKGPKGPVGGEANVLIFPDLHSANIGVKLVQMLAGCRTYGPILTGLEHPAAEISRGASAHDIFGTAVMVGCQSMDHTLLFPRGSTTPFPAS